jgi:hypothetical protein
MAPPGADVAPAQRTGEVPHDGCERQRFPVCKRDVCSPTFGGAKKVVSWTAIPVTDTHGKPREVADECAPQCHDVLREVKKGAS